MHFNHPIQARVQSRDRRLIHSSDIMARKRIILDPKLHLERPVFYHCVLRMLDQNKLIDTVNKEAFRELMREQEVFSGCRVLTYCLMPDHVHLLIEVPPRPDEPISEAELIRRYTVNATPESVDFLQVSLKRAKREGDAAQRAALVDPITNRMYDLIQFVKTLSQKFTRRYNRRNNRRGTLIEMRYQSVVVESGLGSRLVAGYIDMNPVRAGLVETPEEYRWSGYGEAMDGSSSGQTRAQEGLVRAWLAATRPNADARDWKGTTRRMGIGEAHAAMLTGKEVKAFPELEDGVTRALRESLLKSELPEAEVETRISETELSRHKAVGAAVKSRLRALSVGLAVGERPFCELIFKDYRDQFGSKREEGARAILDGKVNLSKFTGLWTLRFLANG